MTLTELQNEVISLTGRPDLAARILSAVRASTLRVHNLDFWYRDFSEKNHTFAASASMQNLDYRVSYPLFKSIKFIKVSDPSFAETTTFIPIVPPENTYDSSNFLLTSMAYLAGQVVAIRHFTPFQYARVGIYEYPDVTVSGYNSWVALDQPFAIVYDATATVLKGIGKLEEAATYEQMAKQEFAMLQKINITPVVN